MFWRGATGQGEHHEHAPAAATAAKEMQPTPAKKGKTAEEDMEVDSYSSAESGAARTLSAAAPPPLQQSLSPSEPPSPPSSCQAPSKSAKVAPGPGLSRAELRDGGALAGGR